MKIDWKTIYDMGSDILKRVGIYTKEDIHGEKTFLKPTMFTETVVMKKYTTTQEDGSICIRTENGEIKYVTREEFLAWVNSTITDNYLYYNGERLTHQGAFITI